MSTTDDYLHTPLDRMLLEDLPKQGLLQLYGVRPPLVIQMNTEISLLTGARSNWGKCHELITMYFLLNTLCLLLPQVVVASDWKD